MLDLEGEDKHIKDLAIIVAGKFNYAPITADLPQRIHNFIKGVFKKQYGMFNNINVDVSVSEKRQSFWFECLAGDWPNLYTVRTLVGTCGIIIKQRQIGRHKRRNSYTEVYRL